MMPAGGGQGVQVNISGGQGVQVNLGGPGRQLNRFGMGSGAEVAGWPLADVTDPLALEVHQPVQLDTPHPDLPMLPVYVPRDHDLELERVVTAAEEGSSRIAVLVGGSSTGKTRACWEALRLLRDCRPGWRLWHPIDPSRPKAALRDLSSVGPRTVVWLNEAQFYLDVAADDLGEQVAAGLRELLRDPGRGPVLVLATLWPQFWDALTVRPPVGKPDLHAQARELLAGRDITVPAAFTVAQLNDLIEARDPRLAKAAAASHDGQVVQFLAGAPELMARYRNAPPAAAALISAAIDARRMGMGMSLPLAFLEAAASGYLTDAEWDGLGEDWLEQALVHTAASCKGIRGPLARIRPRPGHATGAVSETAYRLADYLDQHGRRDRCRYIPPAAFWTAAASLADPADLVALAAAAEDRGLLRDAARLRKRAAAQGDISAAVTLFQRSHFLHLADEAPARWVGELASRAAAHADLSDPSAVARLLDALRWAGAGQQVGELASRAAAHADLSNPSAAVALLCSLEWVDTNKVSVVASRAAPHADLSNPSAVAELLRELRERDLRSQVAALIARHPAAHADVHDPYRVARLLDELREAGDGRQVGELASRAAAHADLHDPSAVTELVTALRMAGADQQVSVLADRVALGGQSVVANLLDAWRWGDLETLGRHGRDEWISLVASRAAAHADLSDPAAAATVLDALRMAGLRNQAALIARDPAAHADLNDPSAVARLLDALLKAGLREQVDALIARDPAAHADLNDPAAVARLLDVLRMAGLREQVDALIARDPAAQAAIKDPSAVAYLRKALRAAASWKQVSSLIACDRVMTADLNDPANVAYELEWLPRRGAHEQVNVLASWGVAHADLNDPAAVVRLLEALQAAGLREQVAALIARDPAAHADLNDPSAVARLLKALRMAGLREQVDALIARDPAAHADFKRGPSAVARLLHALQNAGAHEQAVALAARLPAEGMFNIFYGLNDHQTRYRFGREPDGSPAAPWGWDDLD